MVEHGAVATAHPIAAQVGVDVLKSGGNAVDAAVATGFCLNVIEPWNSSIAGHGQMIVHMTTERRSIAIDYGHRAPRAATADMFRIIGQTVEGNGIYDVEDRANTVGHRSVGVPGITAGMCRAHELFGSLPLEQLLEPAVHYAREGFEADPTACLMIASYMPNLVRYGEAARDLPDGRIPSAARCEGGPAGPCRHSRTDRQRGQGCPSPGRDRGRHRRGDEAKRRRTQRAGPRRLRGAGARNR